MARSHLDPAVAASPPIVPPSASNFQTLTAFDPDSKLPYTLEWNVAFEQAWESNRRSPHRTLVPLEGGSSSQRRYMHRTRILGPVQLVATQPRPTTMRSRSSSNGDCRTVFKRSLPIRGHIRLIRVRLVQPMLCLMFLCLRLQYERKPRSFGLRHTQRVFRGGDI